MFDPTKPVTTRDGQPARIIATDLHDLDGEETIAAIVDGNIATYRPDGSYWPNGKDRMDLVNINKVFVNVYPGGAYRTPDEAAQARGLLRGATVALTLNDDGIVTAVELAQ